MNANHRRGETARWRSGAPSVRSIRGGQSQNIGGEVLDGCALGDIHRSLLRPLPIKGVVRLPIQCHQRFSASFVNDNQPTTTISASLTGRISSPNNIKPSTDGGTTTGNPTGPAAACSSLNSIKSLPSMFLPT